jgi:phosphoglycolate phosphatase
VHKFPSFDFVVSEKTIFGKDKALKRIIKRYGLNKEHVIYVGDEPRDVKASLSAGVKVIAVTWGLGGKEGFEKVTPTALVDTPHELKKKLQELTVE